MSTTLHPLLESSLEITSMRLGLDRMQTLDEILGFPSKAFQSIHVAGTNGKGSVVTKIAASLQSAGKKVGLYTSPHLFSFRERIRVNGAQIGELDADVLLKTIVQTSSIPLSYFELLTMMAFLYFREQKVEIAVIETGLGGRLDATNVIEPLLSVITSISFDHCQYLGSTLEEIAMEKAGIIKENRPVLLGPKAKPLSIFQEIAQKKRSPLFQIEQEFKHYEEENQAIAARALSLLPFSLGPMNGLQIVPPCRFQVVSTSNPIVILDVAHNPDGLERTFKRVAVEFPGRKIRVVAAFSKDKEIDACLAVLKRYATFVTLSQAAHERACPVETFAPFSDVFEIEPSLQKAFEKAFAQADLHHELLLVCGTFFMMSEIRSFGSKLGLEIDVD